MMWLSVGAAVHLPSLRFDVSILKERGECECERERERERDGIPTARFAQGVAICAAIRGQRAVEEVISEAVVVVGRAALEPLRNIAGEEVFVNVAMCRQYLSRVQHRMTVARGLTMPGGRDNPAETDSPSESSGRRRCAQTVSTRSPHCVGRPSSCAGRRVAYKKLRRERLMAGSSPSKLLPPMLLLLVSRQAKELAAGLRTCGRSVRWRRWLPERCQRGCCSQDPCSRQMKAAVSIEGTPYSRVKLGK